MTGLRWVGWLVAAWLLGAVSSTAMADTWRGHLTTLQDARIACRNIDSDSCIPFLAQAVAVADTLFDQAIAVSHQQEFEIPGRNGSIWICGPDVLKELNGQSLLHLALAADTEGYWDNALFTAALRPCRAR